MGPKATLLTLVVILSLNVPNFLLFAQPTYSVDVIGRVWFPSQVGSDTTGGSDCWGYTAPDGTEYALMGVRDGIAVVNAATMSVITVGPGPTSGDFPYKHRDIKTYRNYAYAVAEMTGQYDGLAIMDMQYLPDSVHVVGSFKTATDVRSHNFSIDTAKAHAYILKSNYTGFRIVSLADPENPVEVTTVTTPSIHDVFARNDTVWVAEGNARTFSMYDVSNKSSPALIVRHTIPAGGYVHNIWPTSDGRYAVTTEETSFKTVKVWDTSDPSAVTLVGEYLGSNNLAHNVQVMGDLVYISHYEAGVRVIDISDVMNPVEIAGYDTFPRGNSPRFRGCWGAFPYTANGFFYASDIEGYLTVLRLDTIATTVKQISHEIPNGFRLDQNYPNPFNPSTTIQFSLPQAGHVEIKVFTILGKELATLVSDYLPQGIHAADWNAVGVASGMYFYRLFMAPTAPQHIRSDKAGDPSSRTAGSGQGFVQTKKLVLSK